MTYYSSSWKKVVETGIPKHIPPNRTPVLNTCNPSGVGEGAGKCRAGLFDDDACSDEDDDDDDIPRRQQSTSCHSLCYFSRQYFLLAGVNNGLRKSGGCWVKLGDGCHDIWDALMTCHDHGCAIGNEQRNFALFDLFRDNREKKILQISSCKLSFAGTGRDH